MGDKHIHGGDKCIQGTVEGTGSQLDPNTRVYELGERDMDMKDCNLWGQNKRVCGYRNSQNVDWCSLWWDKEHIEEVDMELNLGVGRDDS